MIAWIARNLSDRLDRRIVLHVESTYQKIEVAPTTGIFNNKCFLNTVEAVLDPTRKSASVIEVLSVDNGVPILHYITKTSSGVFCEITLGHRADYMEYYFLREIHSSDYWKIQNIFSITKEAWNRKYLRWYHRLFGIRNAV